MPSKPLEIRIDLGAVTPAYRQIADALRTFLVDRVFRVGEQLPPVRELAMELGIHHNTVAEAYRQLSDEGWLDLKRRRGATVVDRQAPEPANSQREVLRKRLRELVAEMRAAGFTTSEVQAELASLIEGLSI